MTKLKVNPGMVVSIPCGDYFVAAKVLHISDYFKDVALFKVYPYRISNHHPYDVLFNDDACEFIYTGIDLIKKKEWCVVENIPLLPSEEKHLTKIVGGDVWQGDTYIRAATDADMSTLPKMKVFNVRGVESKVAKYSLAG